MSVRLELVLGIPAKFWNNLEAIYREKRIKVKAENSMESDEVLVKQLPYKEMAKFGWVPSNFAFIAWAQEAKIKARNIKTAPINIKRLIELIPEIRQMTLLEPGEFCSKLKNMLAECGIALVFLPHLKGSFLQGASFMDGNKIVLGLTEEEKLLYGKQHKRICK